MTLLNLALGRLRDRANAALEEPWKPGKQLTDDQLIWAYIQRLNSDLSLAKDDQFLRNDQWWGNGQPYYSEEERKRGEQGIFG